MKLASYTWIGLISLALCLPACGNKKAPLEGADSSLLDSNKQEELYVWVENARIRKQADLNAEVVTEIKGGEKVVLTGEKSSTKTKVKLRGVDVEDIWVKIKTGAGKEGWIFKGMLTDDMTRAQAMNDFLIIPDASVGRVKLGATQQQVEAIFGREFVIEKEIYQEGDAYPGIMVFKDSPLELQCLMDKGKISSIYIRQPGAPWHTAEGVKIGTSLTHLVELNGKDIQFSGWEWDYGGVVLSYNKGKLAAYEKTLLLYLGEPNSIEGLEEFIGDGNFSSASKKLPKDQVKVAEMNLSSKEIAM